MASRHCNVDSKPRDENPKPVAPVQVSQVFMYWPNIIGYARIVLAAIACILMPSRPFLCMAVYLVSCGMDAVDGHVARYLGQCSRFGAVLDMITDRSTTTCLLAYLATIHPSWLPLFQFLMALDLSSHYMHMYASLVAGASSHKQLDGSAHPLLRLYYHNKVVLFLVCAGNELTFVGFYLMHHLLPGTWGFLLAKVLTVVSLPVCVLKQGLNVVQMAGASLRLADLDARTASSASTKHE